MRRGKDQRPSVFAIVKERLGSEAPRRRTPRSFRRPPRHPAMRSTYGGPSTNASMSRSFAPSW